ncbi:MAG: hypothetical protein WDN49_02150 [Acetobacteraceae bacterium]
MHLDDKKISVSLTTMPLKSEDGGTGADDDGGSREPGAGYLLDRLGASLNA